MDGFSSSSSAPVLGKRRLSDIDQEVRDCERVIGELQDQLEARQDRLKKLKQEQVVAMVEENKQQEERRAKFLAPPTEAQRQKYANLFTHFHEADHKEKEDSLKLAIRLIKCEAGTWGIAHGGIKYLTVRRGVFGSQGAARIEIATGNLYKPHGKRVLFCFPDGDLVSAQKVFNLLSNDNCQ